MIETKIKEADGKSWLDVMKQWKPEITMDEADYILWNETCFPFDDETTLKQLETFFKKE